MPLPLVTARLRIERFTEAHVRHPNYLSWLTDQENLKSLNLVSYQLSPVTQERLDRYFEAFKDSTRDHLFAIRVTDGDRFVGTATLREIGHGGLYDLGILVGDKTVRGKGVARETIGAVTRYAFEELGARKVCSSFADSNVAVMLAFLKNGFKIEGLQRQQQMALDGTVSNRYIVGRLLTDS
jgi:RimJ/RimL family protein N-acetyltransferase